MGEGDFRFMDSTEAKANWSEVLRLVHRGEMVFLRRRGKLVAAVVPWVNVPGVYISESKAFVLAMAKDERERITIQQKMDRRAARSQSQGS